MSAQCEMVSGDSIEWHVLQHEYLRRHVATHPADMRPGILESWNLHSQIAEQDESGAHLYCGDPGEKSSSVLHSTCTQSSVVKLGDTFK